VIRNLALVETAVGGPRVLQENGGKFQTKKMAGNFKCTKWREISSVQNGAKFQMNKWREISKENKVAANFKCTKWREIQSEKGMRIQMI
jgi:hypothetical protein